MKNERRTKIMCIAIAKPIGVDIPNDEILKKCFENNSDGAGFAFNYDGQVVIKKGFMQIKDFLDEFHKYNKKFDFKNRGVLIHFRITTHGGTNQAMTHPFPISSDEGILKKIEYSSPYAVIHNGIISLTSSEARVKQDMSDTAIFVQKYLTKIAENKNWFNNKANIELIEDLIDSKMAILNSNGKIIMTSGFTADNGVFYSNSSYKENYYTRYLSRWDDDYGYDYGYGYENYLMSQGYENKNGIWERKDNSNSTTLIDKNKSNCVELMMLQKDQTLVYSDATTEEFFEDILFFVTSDGDVYASFEPQDQYKTEIITPLEYCGVGSIFDKNLNEVAFIPTHYTTIQNLEDWYC